MYYTTLYTILISNYENIIYHFIYRECNKLVARKTRVKKKLELGALQHSFSQLKASNASLRMILKTVSSREISSRILMDCNFQLPDNVVAVVAEMLADMVGR